jgi:hypothetical protein
MLIAIAKNCNLDVSMDARFFVMTYLNEHGFAEIDSICSDYNKDFNG